MTEPTMSKRAFDSFTAEWAWLVALAESDGRWLIPENPFGDQLVKSLGQVKDLLLSASEGLEAPWQSDFEALKEEIGRWSDQHRWARDPDSSAPELDDMYGRHDQDPVWLAAEAVRWHSSSVYVANRLAKHLAAYDPAYVPNVAAQMADGGVTEGDLL